MQGFISSGYKPVAQAIVPRAKATKKSKIVPKKPITELS
jgi:hypothetical protein